MYQDGYILTAPFLVPASSPLYGVNDVFNGIMVTGTQVDNLMFYGRGAGKLPTASAVVSDVIECARTPFHVNNYFADLQPVSDLVSVPEVPSGQKFRILE